MLKILLYVVLGLVLLAVGTTVYMAWRYDPSAEGVLEFLRDEPDRSAISLYRNGEPLIERNENRVMPLASTVKIIVAIEYAEQAAAGELDSEEVVPLADLERFYVEDTDGGAHPAFVESLGDTSSVDLRGVARGMIRFSSNAATEYLAGRLGFDRINARIEALGMKDHTPFYSIVGSLFVGQESFGELSGSELERALRELPADEYIAAANRAGAALRDGPTYRQSLEKLGLDVQKVWSDRLPASTTSEYRKLLAKINSREDFSPEVYEHLSDALEGLMDNPANQEWLSHAGGKGGSTASVLTKATYATDKEGNATEIAYFFDDLGILEGAALQMGMNEFELKILSDPAFRERVIAALPD